MQNILLTEFATPDERIPLVVLWALADWIMVDDSALGIGTTHAHTRINTLQLLAGQVRGTITVDDTFWPAVGRGVNVAHLTRANTNSIHHTLLTVQATGVGIAGVGLNCKI